MGKVVFCEVFDEIARRRVAVHAVEIAAKTKTLIKLVII